MLRQHKHHPNQKEINHKKPTQTYTCYELKFIIEECNEPVSLVAAGNNILVITDTLRNYPLCKGGFRRACMLTCYVIACYHFSTLTPTCNVILLSLEVREGEGRCLFFPFPVAERFLPGQK